MPGELSCIHWQSSQIRCYSDNSPVSSPSLWDFPLQKTLNTSLFPSRKVPISDLKALLRDCYWMKQSLALFCLPCPALHPWFVKITQRWWELGPGADTRGDGMPASCLSPSWVSWAAWAHVGDAENHRECNPPQAGVSYLQAGNEFCSQSLRPPLYFRGRFFHSLKALALMEI